MVYRTVICVLLVGVVGVWLGCGDVAQERETAVGATRGAPPSPHIGVATLENELLRSELVVKASLSTIEATAVSDLNGKYLPAVKFTFNVLEKLHGTYDGATVHAFWIGDHERDTRAEAVRSSEQNYVGRRDTQWDDRNAILFLNKATHSNTMNRGFLETASNFVLALGGGSGEDFHSLYSDVNRTWLPLNGTDATGAQEFLLSATADTVQGATTHTPATYLHPNGETITLEKLKQIITDVTTEYNGGDGSLTYKECVIAKYQDIQERLNHPLARGISSLYWNVEGPVDSGLVANTTISSYPFAVPSADYDPGDVIPAESTAFSIVGTDASLFTFSTTPARGRDSDEWLQLDQLLKTARPLPSGTYEFSIRVAGTGYAICNYTYDDDYSVNVTAPDGVLHELLFDPVTLRQAQGRPPTVGANATNGVLKPASFTDASGGAATINSISYEAGTVKVGVTPGDALAGHIVDFIELDGTMSLSLDVADATVDPSAGSGQAGTLNWSVSSQPWHDGDKLMVRIREAR